MSAITTATKPSLRHGFRLQWEPAQAAHVLLYPEGMVKLNVSAGEIMTRCDGVRTIGEIAADLERAFGASSLYDDVTAFVCLAVERKWLELQA